MSVIVRNPEQTARDRFDVIVIGGGIHGSMLLLEAARAGLRALLLERADFGGGTSANNLRIVHGGLRYLQSLDVGRSRESAAEQSWFLRTFPELVRPLPCLMPLHGGLMRSPLLLRAALRFNDLLLGASRPLPPGGVLGVEETCRRFPRVRRQGLRGGALWHDAVMPDCNRVQIECLRWAAAAGGTALNYVEATELLRSQDGVQGVVATDHVAARTHEFRADVVVNAAGPASRTLAGRFDVDRPELFRASLAWNLLLDRPPLADGAVVLQAPGRGSRAYFSHSARGRMLVGTGHAAVLPGSSLRLESDHVNGMLRELNAAVPGLDLQSREIVRSFSGQLPVERTGTTALCGRTVILDHHRHGGPRGLHSVSGVKYTTARSTAASVIRRLAPLRTAPANGLPERPSITPYQLHPDDCPDRDERIRRARNMIESEAPRTLADLLLRRSNLAFDPGAALAVADDGCAAFGWSGARAAEEIARLEDELGYASPGEGTP